MCSTEIRAEASSPYWLLARGIKVTEDFRVIAKRRLREALVLQAAGEHSGAYYLAGYAVECALKACVLKDIKRYHMPEKRVVAEGFTHDLNQLVKLAGLEAARNQLLKTDSIFATNWALTKDWNEVSRYQTWSQQDAADLIGAINQRGKGVFSWVKRHW